MQRDYILLFCVLIQVCMRLRLTVGGVCKLYQHQSTSSVAGCCAGLRCCTRMAREPHPQATAPQDRAAARRTDSNNHTHSSAGDSCSSLNRFKPHLGFVFLMLPIQKLALVYKRENWLAINFMLFQGSCMIDLQAVS